MVQTEENTSPACEDKTDRGLQEDRFAMVGQLSIAIVHGVDNKVAIPSATVDADRSNQSPGKTADGAQPLIHHISTVDSQFNGVYNGESAIASRFTDEKGVNLVMEVDTVSSGSGVLSRTSGNSIAVEDQRKTDAMSGVVAASVTDVTGIGEMTEIASTTNKRVHEEERDCAASDGPHPCKRVAVTDDDGTVAQFADQVMDTTLGDSSGNVEMIEPTIEEEVLWSEAVDACEKSRRLYDKVEYFAERNRELAPTFVQAGLTRSGRTITKLVGNEICKPRVLATKKKEVLTLEPKFPEESLCGVCGEVEDDDLTDMIFCDGGCLKSYHFSCLGIDSAPEDEEWLCEQCRTNEQLCFACGRNGTINEKGGVFCCNVASCGKFYHQACIDANKMSRRGAKAKPSSSTVDEMLVSDASFRCPRHACLVCKGERKSRDLMHCLKCPEAYHPRCVPPSARYNSVGLLCWRHHDDKLPKIPSFYLSDPNIDTVTVDSTLCLPWMFSPKRDPDASKPNDCHHFRLFLNHIEDVRLQPPAYRKLGRSIYTFKMHKVSLDDAPACVCRERCGDYCINRLSFTECYGPAPTPGMKFNRQNRESNCMLGECCGNRALHQKVYPRFEKFHTVEKGWGLRVLEQVKAGQLVIEYVGEVINEEEKERRLLDHAKHSPEDKNMYIMELGKGEYIDARFKGSVSRFINHSCDPNCHLLKWRVKGVNRIAITALKDIEPGTELSYDYQFHTKQAMEWKCHCEANCCRGTMAPEKLNQAQDVPLKKLTKKEKVKQRKRALIQEKIQHVKEVKSTAKRLSLTVQISMGDRMTTDKMTVRTGPAARELQWAKLHRLFNMRDAQRGCNFKLRRELRDRRCGQRDTIYRVQQTVSELTAATSSRLAYPIHLPEDESEPVCNGGHLLAKDTVSPDQPAATEPPVVPTEQSEEIRVVRA
uniref:Histone-lysine N-methyltransferase n=1 Tax=Hyaloperonospora arabidopsidis (strain Emoy2) TaxID=559515 RepID=M4BXT8_HYAAE